MMERRMKRKFHVRCEAGENLEITSKSYLSLSFDMEKHLKRRPAIVKPDEVFDYYEIDAADLQEDADHEET